MMGIEWELEGGAGARTGPCARAVAVPRPGARARAPRPCARAGAAARRARGRSGQARARGRCGQARARVLGPRPPDC